MDLFKKTYEIYGMVEKSCVFKIGSGFIRADFKNGSLATSGVIPASFTTADQVVQCAIEASDKYKTGIVKLGKAVKIGEVVPCLLTPLIAEDTPERAIKPVAEPDSNPAAVATENGGTGGGGVVTGEPVDYPDVVTGQAARAILSVEPYNVSLAKLQRNDEIRVVATEVGVTFSNWK